MVLLQYGYNNIIIIIIINVIIFDFLFVRFVHPSAQRLTILSFLKQVRT